MRITGQIMQFNINERTDDWDMQDDWTNGSGHVCQQVTDKEIVSKLIKKARYLRCLLRFQFPEQLALLGHTGMWTGGGVCLCAGRGRSGGGRRHAWFVVHTCLLLKLGLQRERERKRMKFKIIGNINSLCFLSLQLTHLQRKQLLNCLVNLIFRSLSSLELADSFTLCYNI